MERKTWRESIKDELQKLSEMSLPKKAEYIWDYYKPLLAGIFAVVFLAVVLTCTIRNNRIVTELSVAFVNTCDSETLDIIHDEYLDYAGMDSSKQDILLDAGYQIREDSIDQLTLGSQTKLLASLSAGSLDLMILPEKQFKTYQKDDAYLELGALFDQEQLQELEELLVAGKDGSGITEGFYGLDVTDCAKLKGMFQESPVILAVPVGAENTKNIKKFVQYLLS